MFWRRQIQLIEDGGGVFLQGNETMRLLSGVRRAPE